MRTFVTAAALCTLAVSFVDCQKRAAAPVEQAPDPSNKEGGTGTRAKGEEGSMGSPRNKRYGVQGPRDSDLKDLQEFGMIGLLPSADPNAPTAPWGRESDLAGTPSLARRLDPNARYATTYRPGGGMLSAFDAAIAQGVVPASYRPLVAELGGAHVSTIDEPKDRALAFRVETERGSAAPAGGFMHLRVSMRSSSEITSRAHLGVHLVMDVSGSMAGASIDNAKSAARALVKRLSPADTFSLSTFSDAAKLVVPAAPIGTRADAIARAIDAVVADGGTNISAGLSMGYVQAKASAATDTAVVMLISDGHATNGETSAERLASLGASALGDSVQTSTFGVGSSFDAQLLSSIADRGAGAYYYLKDSTQIAHALQTELESRLVPVAQAVELRIRLAADVAPTRVYGSRELRGVDAENVRQQEVAVDKNVARKAKIAADRQSDAQGGMRFFIPAIARDDRHALMLKLALPPGVAAKDIATVEVRYKDLVRKKNVTDEMRVNVRYATSDAESAATRSSSVAASVLAFAAGDAALEAAELAGRGNAARAAALLREQVELLASGAKELGDARLLAESARLEKLASSLGEGRADPMGLALLLREAAYRELR